MTIRNMYEVGQRVPPQTSAMSLSAAQAWDSSHREVCLQLSTHARLCIGPAKQAQLCQDCKRLHQHPCLWSLLLKV